MFVFFTKCTYSDALDDAFMCAKKAVERNTVGCQIIQVQQMTKETEQTELLTSLLAIYLAKEQHSSLSTFLEWTKLMAELLAMLMI